MTTVTVLPTLTEYGDMTTGGGQYQHMSNAKLEAISGIGRQFSYWTKSDDESWTSYVNPIQIVVPQDDITYVAHFFNEKFKPVDEGDDPVPEPY